MTKSTEGYKPSAEDMEAAEEIMTPAQKEISNIRENKLIIEQMKAELHVTGNIGMDLRGDIGGTLNGHEVHFRNNGSGTIDGVLIGVAGGTDEGSELVRSLYSKYFDLAKQKIGSGGRRVQLGNDRERSIYEAKTIQKARVEVQEEAELFEEGKHKTEPLPDVTDAIEAAKALLSETPR